MEILVWIQFYREKKQNKNKNKLLKPRLRVLVDCCIWEKTDRDVSFDLEPIQLCIELLLFWSCNANQVLCAWIFLWTSGSMGPGSKSADISTYEPALDQAWKQHNEGSGLSLYVSNYSEESYFLVFYSQLNTKCGISQAMMYQQNAFILWLSLWHSVMGWPWPAAQHLPAACSLPPQWDGREHWESKTKITSGVQKNTVLMGGEQENETNNAEAVAHCNPAAG